MDNQELYIKGFNNGYLLSKHNPKLMEKLEKVFNPIAITVKACFRAGSSTKWKN